MLLKKNLVYDTKTRHKNTKQVKDKAPNAKHLRGETTEIDGREAAERRGRDGGGEGCVDDLESGIYCGTE